jgi:hypothetical protein
MRGIGAGLALILAVSLGAPARAAPSPNLRGCAPPEVPDSGERQRAAAIPVPPALRGLLRSSLYHFAVTTLNGGAICIDTSWIETAENLALTPDGRFVSFGWLGYETYGHYMVDRAGKGAAIETGVTPVFSPSRRRFAAADQTESEFGALSGLAVWQVDAKGTAEIARIADLPRLNGWRVDRWAGEACIELSALPTDIDPAAARPGQRVRFRAGPAKAGWRVTRAPRGCAG